MGQKIVLFRAEITAEVSIYMGPEKLAFFWAPKKMDPKFGFPIGKYLVTSFQAPNGVREPLVRPSFAVFFTRRGEIRTMQEGGVQHGPDFEPEFPHTGEAP